MKKMNQSLSVKRHENELIDHEIHLKNPEIQSTLAEINLMRDYIAEEAIIVSHGLFEKNSIIEIRHAYDLDKAQLILPENVTLKFIGGSISNGTIVGDNTKVIAGLVKIFGLDIRFKGTWDCATIYPEWFDA